MKSSESLIARRQVVTPRGVSMVTPVVAASARGAIIVDPEGREYIDFVGGIGVMNVGHGRAEIVDAIKTQCDALLHTCFQVASYEPYVLLCEKMVELFPHGEHTKVMLVNTGAEAVENAIKIARQATNRPAVICFSEGFHGRTMMAMSLTSKVNFKIGCGPYAPEVYRLPFPNYFHYGDGLSEHAFVQRELRRFRELLLNSVPAEQVAAVIMEPIQGEGGFNPAPLAYLSGLRKLCDEFGILLILDEVQSGFCRTGRWAAYEHYGVVPDLSTWAKSMGGGMPIACVMGRADVMDAARPGTIGGTYGGNPVSCAASLATIELMEREQLNARAEIIGERVTTRLNELQKRFPKSIGDVRGLGAMIGVEFVVDGDHYEPATQLTNEILAACVSRGLLIIGAGVYGNVIRFLAPLVITDEQLDRGLSILCEEIVSAIENTQQKQTIPTKANAI
ncbi:4-aminobutyrate--2-oxoglutarate transaminase [Novipirellula sp. SH528]|uniref:4-aminobutyrate--2-oxoglutarate transaminase n=1 Tax=Novipirellula sp. SH528 TaxID=3454466 RepID=UPI003F9F09BF